MIQLSGAAKRFGLKTLFENLDWLVTSNERAGIVGTNGSGNPPFSKSWPAWMAWMRAASPR